MIMAHEDGRLAVTDTVSVQLGGFGDHVQLVVVDLELRRTLRVHRVVDGQRMQAVGSLERAQLFRGRLTQTDPAEA
jgi:hypothetical protein